MARVEHPGGPGTRRGLDGQVVLTPAQFNDVITQTLTGKATPTQFFNGAKDRPAGLINNWTEIDVAKAFAMVGMPNQNYDCVKECMANDGKVYAQPVQKVRTAGEALRRRSGRREPACPEFRRVLRLRKGSALFCAEARPGRPCPVPGS